MGIKERKEREKEERRTRIQEAAKKIFMLKGFRSATIEDIANKAELSAATIYLYFKNKEELYCSLNSIGLNFLFNEIRKIYNNNRLTVEEKIMHFKEAMFKSFQRDPLRLQVIVHVQMEDTLLSIDKDLLDHLNELGQKILGMIGDVYEEGVRQGKFIEGHSRAFADIIWSTFMGLVLWEESKKKLNPKKNFLKPTLDLAFDFISRGIKKKKLENHRYLEVSKQ